MTLLQQTALTIFCVGLVLWLALVCKLAIVGAVEDRRRLTLIDGLLCHNLADLTPTIRVKLDEGAFLPTRAHDTDAGADICSPRSFTLPAGAAVRIRTGVHVELPPNTVGMLKSKSGLNRDHGIVGEGVIDEGYDGMVEVKLYNLSRRPHTFKRGDKLIQLVVLPVLYPTYIESESIACGTRGSAGFGSTGS